MVLCLACPLIHPFTGDGRRVLLPDMSCHMRGGEDGCQAKYYCDCLVCSVLVKCTFKLVCSCTVLLASCSSSLCACFAGLVGAALLATAVGVDSNDRCQDAVMVISGLYITGMAHS